MNGRNDFRSAHRRVNCFFFSKIPVKRKRRKKMAPCFPRRRHAFPTASIECLVSSCCSLPFFVFCFAVLCCFLERRLHFSRSNLFQSFQRIIVSDSIVVVEFLTIFFLSFYSSASGTRPQLTSGLSWVTRGLLMGYPWVTSSIQVYCTLNNAL